MKAYSYIKQKENLKTNKIQMYHFLPSNASILLEVNIENNKIKDHDCKSDERLDTIFWE